MTIPITNNARMPLGRKAPRYDPRTFMLASYLVPGATGHLPKPLPAATWSRPVKSWEMHLNDLIGCCTCATAAHMIRAWTANSDQPDVVVPDEEVLKAYQAVGGYVPNDPSTDGGAIELDLLKHWRKQGIGGHKIGAYASVGTRSRTLVMDAIYLFGGIYTGFALPITAQQQPVWDVVPGAARERNAEAGSWGGHAVPVIDYNWRGLACITWGKVQYMTWAFFKTYCDEAYAIMSRDFVNDDGVAPSGFDLSSLRRDLGLLAG